jgi:hypothetical protein
LGLAPINHLERQGVGPLGEFQRDGRHGGSCAVLDREPPVPMRGETTVSGNLEYK